MKHISSYLMYCLLAFVGFSCGKSNNIEPKRIVIAGHVTNYNSAVHDHLMQFQYHDFIEESAITKTIEISSEGNFKFSFERSFPQEVYLIYGALVPILVAPNDSIFLKIDPRILNTKSDSIYRLRYQYITADSLSLNYYNLQFSAIFLDSLWKENQKVDDSIKDLQAMQYKYFVENQKNIYTGFLNGYISKYKPSKEFIAWEKDNIKYSILNPLLRYWWLHAMKNNITDTNSIKQLPANFNSFLKDEKIDLHSFRTSYFAWDFLHENYIYNLVSARIGYPPNDTFIFERTKKLILNNYKGSLRQALLATFYFRLLDKSNVQKYTELFDSMSLTEPYYIHRLNQKFTEITNLIKNPVLSKESHLNEMDNKVLAAFLDSITIKYKGKVLYIDFWAVWCGPCLSEMPNSQTLQNEYKGKNVAFIFFCCSSKKDLWKATISKSKLEGEHYLLTDDQFKALSGEFNIPGFPHYVLIDKQSRIVNKNAPRPSDSEAIKKAIDLLIAK